MREMDHWHLMLEPPPSTTPRIFNKPQLVSQHRCSQTLPADTVRLHPLLNAGGLDVWDSIFFSIARIYSIWVKLHYLNPIVPIRLYSAKPFCSFHSYFQPRIDNASHFSYLFLPMPFYWKKVLPCSCKWPNFLAQLNIFWCELYQNSMATVGHIHFHLT